MSAGGMARRSVSSLALCFSKPGRARPEVPAAGKC